MKYSISALLFGRLTLFTLFSLSSLAIYANGPARPMVARPKTEVALRFTENKNQWDARVQYKVGLPSGALFLEANRLTYSFIDAGATKCTHPHVCNETAHTLRGHAYYVNFLGAAANPKLTAENPYSDYENFFIGNDESRWANKVLSYRKATYKNLYEGIDMALYSDAKGGSAGLKYDFILAAGADASQIQMQYEGIDRLALQDGKLVLRTSVNTMTEEIPLAYQIFGNEKRPTPCEYRLNADGRTVSFYFPKGYDKNAPLVIDPALVFATYSGSTADNWGFTAAFDPTGALYSGGIVHTVGYPASPGAFQTHFQGGGDFGSNESLWYGSDMGLIKYSSDGTQRLWATYLGGSLNEQPHSLIASKGAELFVLGTTRSEDFPTTLGAYDTIFNGGVDIVVVRLKADGTGLLGSTFFGGVGLDGLNLETLPDGNDNPLYHFYADDSRGEIILDGAGNPCVASSTTSENFPVTDGAYQTALKGVQDACVFMFNPELTQLKWSTYLGGTKADAGYSVKIASNGAVYVTGGTTSTNFPITTGAWRQTYQGGSADGYVSCLKPNGTGLAYSTFIGTSKYDQSYMIELDDTDVPYIVGQTEGAYPVFNAPYFVANAGQFITKLAPTLEAPVYSTRFGKAGFSDNVKADITPTAFLVDICQNVYVSGWGGMNGQGNMQGLFLTQDAFQSTTDGEDFYLFVLKSNAQSVMYATYFGGSQSHDHVDGGTSRFDKNGIVYQAVCASCGGVSSDFPVTPDAWSTTNNSENCNNGAFKFKFDLLDIVTAKFIPAFSDGIGCAPVTVSFVNTSTAGLTYEWDLGDGTISTQTSPLHTYTQPGTYTVILTAKNANKCNKIDIKKEKIIIRGPADAAFTWQNNACSKVVTFDNQSVGGTKFLWEFGDGATAIDSMPGPHTYPAYGNYHIRLTVNPNTACADTLGLNVNVGQRPKAAFTPTSACANLVQFHNLSVDAESYLWTFNNADTSTAANPFYVFPGPGTYPVRLFASNGSTCGDTLTTQMTIAAGPLLSATNVNPTCGSCPTGKITVMASGGTPPYKYKLNDGAYQTANVFTGLVGGLYVVTVKDAGGCETTLSISLVGPNLCPAPTNFSVSVLAPGAYLFTWSASAGAANYTLRYKPVSDVNWTFLTITGTSRQVNGLNPQVEYEAQIRANCVQTGSGAYAQSINFGGDATPSSCATPAGLTISNIGQTTVLAKWTAVSGATSYQVQYRRASGGSWQTVTAAGTSVTLTGLTSGMSYLARVRAVCGNNTALWSTTVPFTTDNGTRLGASSTLEGSGDGLSALTLYPNPNKGAYTLAFTAPENGTAILELFDAVGRRLERQTLDFNDGDNAFAFESPLPSGVYLLRLVTPGEIRALKMVVE